MASVGSAALQDLKHVRTTGVRERDLETFPDFLVLGPQRTGTTWMAKVLWRHPNILMSFPKELYFFNLLEKPSHRFFRSNELRWYLSHFRDDPATRALKTSIALLQCRVPYRPIIRGEATASYAAMDPSLIADVVTLNPRIKGIVMVRDPVDRAWSHAKKDLSRSRNRRLEEVPEDDFMKFFSDPYQRACADYDRIVQNWSAALQPGHLFVGAFEEIAAAPRAFLQRLLDFLGVPNDLQFASNFLNERVNATEDVRIPERQRAMLREALGRELCDDWRQVLEARRPTLLQS